MNTFQELAFFKEAVQIIKELLLPVPVDKLPVQNKEYQAYADAYSLTVNYINHGGHIH